MRTPLAPETIARRVRRWKLTRRMDELRVLSGEPQRTGFVFKSLPTPVRKAKCHLAEAFGYVPDPGEPLTLRYTPDTIRRPHGRGGWATERYYTEKYGLAFKPAGRQDTKRQDTDVQVDGQ